MYTEMHTAWLFKAGPGRGDRRKLEQVVLAALGKTQLSVQQSDASCLTPSPYMRCPAAILLRDL